MAIVRMKRFCFLGLESDREKLLYAFQHLGCIQINSQAERLADEAWAGQVTRSSTGLAEARDKAGLLQNALNTLSKYAEVKGPGLKAFFNPRPVVTMKELHDPRKNKDVLSKAAEIQKNAGAIGSLTAERGRLESRLAALKPWRDLDVPLEEAGSPVLTVEFGVCPSSVDIEALAGRLQKETACCIEPVGKDSDQHYLCVLLHPSSEREAADILNPCGYSRVQFKDMTGTARENIEMLEAGLKENDAKKKGCQEKIAAFSGFRPDLLQALDAANVEVQRQEAAERLLSTGSAFYMEGWVPEKVIPKLEAELDKLDCAYESRSPGPDDEPPVLLQNGKLTQPFSMVTNMYALPKYNNIDPNPLIAPFYAIFFGMMYGDAAYGAILLILGWIVTKKGKPKGMMGSAFKMMQICGITTIISGFVFGGFFGDAVTVVGKTFFNADWAFPTLWVGPTDSAAGGPMKVLIFALVLGGIQIISGMAIKGYLLIRDGQPLAAVMEVLPWWAFFASIAVTVLAGQAFWIFIGLGLLVLTQGYKKKGIVKKLLFGVVSLYDITAYLGDILSYSRLMALGLAGGVIGSVFNFLGAMPSADGLSGPMIVIGPLVFLVIFLAGHGFNMAINIIGTYVHAARLQYIEYFSKFYEDGGQPFRPLCAQTKYIDVVEPKA